MNMNFNNNGNMPNNDDKEEGKTSLLSRIFKNEDGQIYSEVIIKGFVWVVMFSISLVALFLIFKGGKHYSNKEVVVVNSDGDNDYMKPPEQDSNKFTFNQAPIRDYGKFSNNTTSESPNSDDNKTKTKDKVTQNSDNKAQSSKKESNKKVDSSSKKSFNLTGDDKIGALIKTHKEGGETKKDDNFKLQKENTVANNSNNKDIIKNQHVNNVKSSNNQVEVKKSVEKANVSNKNTVWLVNIYSGVNMAIAKDKWNSIQKQHPELFMNKQAYFIKVNISGRTYYRVSIGDAEVSDIYPHFSSRGKAKDYCMFLKSYNIDCFISSTSKDVVKGLAKEMEK